MNVSRLDRALFERSLVRHTSGVSLLAPPRHYDDIARITAEGVHQVVALARSAFPYVLADLDNSFGPEQVEVLRQADLVLLVIRLDFVSLRNTRRVLEHLERLGIDRGSIRVVVNRYGQPKEVPASKAEEALGLKVFHYVPDDPKAVNRANNLGVPVVLEAPRAAVSRSVAKLAQGVNGRLPKH
jgi:pilus assembly protein CpaE